MPISRAGICLPRGQRGPQSQVFEKEDPARNYQDIAGFEFTYLFN